MFIPVYVIRRILFKQNSLAEIEQTLAILKLESSELTTAEQIGYLLKFNSKDIVDEGSKKVRC